VIIYFLEKRMAPAATKKLRKEEALGELESLLANTFKPVSPRQTYVNDLNRRLTNYPTPLPEIVAPRLPRNTAGVTLIVIMGTALLVLGVRALIPILASLTSYINVRKEMRSKELGVSSGD
jgi:hypothetical protein